jgi:hypothetical protein
LIGCSRFAEISRRCIAAVAFRVDGSARSFNAR